MVAKQKKAASPLIRSRNTTTPCQVSAQCYKMPERTTRTYLPRFNLGGLLPVDGFLAVLNEVRVGFREVFVPEKAVVRRKGRGMRALKGKVFCTVDVRTFLFRIISPQYEDEMLALIIQLFYRRIGKSLPTFSLVRARTTSVD